jgi:formylglycine-generating enzyme
MIRLQPGTIVLHDEGTHRRWRVDVRSFELAQVPVTRRTYTAMVGGHDLTNPERPVTNVSWNEAVHFCNRLSTAAGLHPCYSGIGGVDAERVTCDFTCDGFRLPTEAEWEFACRAGSTQARHGALDDIAWYRGNSGATLHDVGGKAPNQWGLHDMLGNAWEWCWDLFDPEVYGPYRVFRGGGFADPERSCRASCRRKSHPTFAIDDLSFRLARTLPD